jgi:hypothetical protein
LYDGRAGVKDECLAFIMIVWYSPEILRVPEADGRISFVTSEHRNALKEDNYLKKIGR